MSNSVKAARGFFSDFRSLRTCLGDSDFGKTTMGRERFAVMVYLSGMFLGSDSSSCRTPVT